MLGFVAAGGSRKEQVVRYLLVSEAQPTTIGEPSGEITPRLREVGALLQRAGFPVMYEAKIDDWLRTHVALVVPIAMAIYAAGGSTRKVAESPRIIRLMIDAIKEGCRALGSAGFTVTPFKYRLLGYVPTTFLVPMLRKGHHLYGELRATMAGTKVPTRAFDELADMAWSSTGGRGVGVQ